MEPSNDTFPGLKQIFPGFEQTFGPFDPPLSTENSIIFPFNPSSKNFSRGTYSAKLTQGRASVDDMNQVLTLVELVLSRLESTREVIMNFLLRIFIPLLLIIYSWEVYLFRSSVLEILSPIYVIYIAFTGTALIVERATQKRNTEADIQKIIEMIRPAYAKRGLSWHLSDEFFSCWLELRKESQTGEQGQAQSVHDKPLESFEYTSPIFSYGLLYTDSLE